MALIPEAIIDEVQARTDIVEVIGSAVKLVRSGNHYKARCPFHREKTPSFLVNPDKQIYHCFGCGVGGNVFSFLMQHDRLSFPEAVRLLAEKSGVPIPESAAALPRESADKRESAFGVLEKCAAFFEKCLQHPENGENAREYIRRRGVDDKTREKFRLGVAPNEWDRLIKAAQTAGVGLGQLESAGLIVKKPERSYDRFRNRLIFPIVDLRGRVIAFGGRSLGEEQPKYLNSPETTVYQKSHHLFGLYQSKQAIVERGYAVLVEGYFDCVVLAAAGIDGVVAPLGTALTVQQVRLLKRYTERVVIAFDGDAAGQAAARRSIDILIEGGVQASVMDIPSGMDPDDLVRRDGAQAFNEKAQKAVSGFEYLLNQAVEEFPQTNIENRVKAARLLLPTVAKMQDAIAQNEYLRLVSDRLGLDEISVRREFRSIKTGRSHESAEAVPRKGNRLPRGPEQVLAALLIEDNLRWQEIGGRVDPQAFEDESLVPILKKIAETAEKRLEPVSLMSRFEDESARSKIAELLTLAETLQSKPAAMEDCIKRIQQKQKQNRLLDIRNRIRTAQEAGRQETVYALLAEYQRQVKGG